MNTISVKTHSQTELIDITSDINKIIRNKNIQSGICQVFVPHTTAAVTINENADPSVKRDLLYELNKVIPFDDGYHHSEGNSAAHIKTTLTGSSEFLIIDHGKLVLGTWQSVFFAEFDGPRNRKVHIKIISDN